MLFFDMFTFVLYLSISKACSQDGKDRKVFFLQHLNNFCNFLYVVFVNGTAISKNKPNVDVQAFRWYGEHLSENLLSFM